MDKKKYDHMFKFIVIGNSGVGKSNFLFRYVTGKFDKTHDITIGVEFFTKIIEYDGKVYKINIWDTAGQESFKSITKIYYRGCSGCVVVYDVTNIDSFKSVGDWIEEARNNSKSDLIIVLVANKCDHKNRVISTEEGRDLAEHYGITYVETSALTGDNIADPFMAIVEKLNSNIQTEKDSIRLEYPTDTSNKSKYWCGII